jgi:group I intron endonuclease
MKSGVYRITNKVNGKFYVGSAKDIDQRWDCHRNDLRAGKHVNPKLQHAWDFYGEDKFLFEIVEEVDSKPELLFERENHYLSTLKPYERKVGYNICPTAEGGDNFTHNPRKEEIRAFWLIHNKGEGNPMFGKTHSEEAIQQQKDKAIGRYTLEWFVKRYGEAEGEKKYQERRLMLMNRDKSVFCHQYKMRTFKGKKHKSGWIEKKQKTQEYFKNHWKEFVSLIKSNRFSQRQLSEILNIPRNTLRQKITKIVDK